MECEDLISSLQQQQELFTKLLRTQAKILTKLDNEYQKMSATIEKLESKVQELSLNGNRSQKDGFEFESKEPKVVRENGYSNDEEAFLLETPRFTPRIVGFTAKIKAFALEREEFNSDSQSQPFAGNEEFALNGPSITSSPIVQNNQPVKAKPAQVDPKDFRQIALNAHNVYRRVHNATMLKLDAELNKSAQNLAEELASRNTLVLVNRKNLGYGENIYRNGTKSEGPGEDVLKAIAFWYNEKWKYNWDNPNSNTKQTEHFSQVVWRRSTEIGIGVATNLQGATYVVANYHPAGNLQGRYHENVVCA